MSRALCIVVHDVSIQSYEDEGTCRWQDEFELVEERGDLIDN